MQKKCAEIVKQLKNEILNGSFQPDEWIKEEILTDRLHVSRTPVREALIILENEGFIRSVPRKGRQVNEISTQTIFESYVIMSALEELAVRTAGPFLNVEDFRVLESLIDTIDRLNKIGETSVSKFHRNFHEFFIEKSCNLRLKQLLHEYYNLFTKKMNQPARMSDEPVEECRGIVEALFARDYELAGRLMRYHITKGMEARIKVFDSLKNND